MPRIPSNRSITFAETSEESTYPALKPISKAEATQHHDAQEDFESRRCSHACSLVFGLAFTIGAIVVFFVGANKHLDDLYVIGAILLVFGVVLLSLSLVLLCRGYWRAKKANTKIFDTRLPPKRRVTKEDTVVTQSDVSIRAITPAVPSQNRRLTTEDLYSDSAIKQSDIKKFQSALDEHQKENSSSSRNRIVIQLGDVSDSHDDEVLIIHDAKIALPRPQQNENANTSDDTRTTASGDVVMEQSKQVQVGRLPGTPDLAHTQQNSGDDVTADIPQAFDYVDPHERTVHSTPLFY